VRFVLEVELEGDLLTSDDTASVELQSLLDKARHHLVQVGIPARPRSDRKVLLDGKGNRVGHLRFDP
jgi:hypothetical protein